jgi:hypothetical protein
MSDRRAWLARLAPLAVPLAVGLALIVPQPAGLELAAGGSARAVDFAELVGGRANDAVVLVAFDPDLGTYPEIRPTVRALLTDLLDRGTDLAFVSFTPEGRALGSIELARLADAGVAEERVADLGFRSGAEAALVELTRDPLAGVSATGRAAEALSQSGLKGLGLAIVVGGNDLGPRSWIEQVRTRAPSVPIAAITPTVLLPELTPYLESGQLAGLLGTVADGAAYRAQLAGTLPAAIEGEARPPNPLALVAGILLAVVVLGQSAAAALAGAARGLGRSA